MPYCAICGRHHAPGVGCFDGTRELLEDAGAKRSPAMSGEESRLVAKQADRWILKVLIWALVVIALLFVIASLIKT